MSLGLDSRVGFVNVGNVVGEGLNVGGIIGINDSYFIIENSVNIGDIRGGCGSISNNVIGSRVGGIVGYSLSGLFLLQSLFGY